MAGTASFESWFLLRFERYDDSRCELPGRNVLCGVFFTMVLNEPAAHGATVVKNIAKR